MSDRPRQSFLLRQQQVMERYGCLYEEIIDIFDQYDPLVAPGWEHHEKEEWERGEYSPEVVRILPRLEGAQSLDDVRRIVHEVFLYNYGSDGQPNWDYIGPEERFQRVSVQVWDAWKLAHTGQ